MLRVRIAARAAPGPARVLPCGEIPESARAAAAVAGFTAKAGETCEVFADGEHLLLVGIGAGRELEAAGAAAIAELLRQRRIVLDARGLTPPEAAALIAGAVLRAWRFDKYQTRPREDAPLLADIDVVSDAPAAARAAWREIGASVTAANFARDLISEPGNVLTPPEFARRLKALTKQGIEVEILGRAELARQGLGAILAVGQGSAHPPCLAVLRWPGRSGGAPVAFVGKGITFDTGGISIKPAAGMERMKGDMGGAAAAAGALLALALRDASCPAVAVLALAENALGANAYRPGDVVRSYSGQTIEVIDTDAEGRMVLADALAWTARTIAPRAMVDLATLTGSIVTALGEQMAGMFATDDSLGTSLRLAGNAVGERVWPMPLAAGYRDDLASDIADLKQCASGRGNPDACHAAAFLRAFVADVPWIHLDIAGVAGVTGKGPTSFGVRLLDRWVRECFGDG